MGKGIVPKGGNDCIQTPVYLAREIVEHFKPKGKILEPCIGKGQFLKALPKHTKWCEVSRGRDFFATNKHYDWIVTNPPYSKFRDFLSHSLYCADNVIFLIPLIHMWTKARLKIVYSNNFGIKEIYCINTPKEFPQMGFQMGCVYYKRGYKGKIKFTIFLEKMEK